MIVAEARSASDMAAVRALRHAVFVVEQSVPEAEEWDGRDAAARHLLARIDGQPAGTLRWRIIGDVAKIERVCVARRYRGRDLGTALMIAALRRIRAVPGVAGIRLGAQLTVIGFYERLGFIAEGPVYPEAGIDHRDMVLAL